MVKIFQGLRINVENPAGSTRSGVDQDGKPWSVVMVYPYGYIVGTYGIDGDEVDCFIGPDKSAKFVYIVHQTNKVGTKWDEDKVMLGFDDVMDAKSAYYKSFDKPDLFYGSMTTLTVEDFKKRLKDRKGMMIMGSSKPKSKLEVAYELYSPVESV